MELLPVEARAETRIPEPYVTDGPLAPGQALPTAIMFAIAMIGGALNFYKKWKEGHARAFNVTEFVGEVVISGLAGILAFWLFRGLGVNEWLTAAGVGVVGHMGSRALFIAEKAIEGFAEKWKDK